MIWDTCKYPSWLRFDKSFYCLQSPSYYSGHLDTSHVNVHVISRSCPPLLRGSLNHSSSPNIQFTFCNKKVFLTQALGMGLGQALLFLPSLSILGQHFRRRRALAIGIATSVNSISASPFFTSHLDVRILRVHRLVELSGQLC